MTSRGKLISLEGGEGAGKSTQVRAVAAALRSRGLDVLETREPGGSEGAERIRELLLTGDEDRWRPGAEALLFAAARADHVDKTIRPALERGTWVISDRFLDSSLAYQGGAGGLGIAEVRAVNDFGLHGFRPDRTFILSVEDSSARARARDKDRSDRIGGRSHLYHQQVDAAFRQIALEDPGRVRIFEASGTAEEVTKRLLDAIADLLP